MPNPALTEPYQELIQLTKSFLKQEFCAGARLWTTHEEVESYAPWSAPKKAAPPLPPKPVVRSAPPKPRPQPRPLATPVAKEPEKPRTPEKVIREAAAQVDAVDCNEVRTLMQRLFPKVPLLAEPLDDKEARVVKERWKTERALPPVAVLVGEHDSPQLLANIARALSLPEQEAAAVPVTRVDCEQGWDAFFARKSLQRVIATESTLEEHSDLRERRSVSDRGPLLGNTPLFVLPESDTLLGEIDAKRQLWTTLKRDIRS